MDFALDPWAIVPIVFALSFHEFSHAYVAYRLGDPTAARLGRLTLNPLRHLDPMGTLLLFFVGFGWAKPVPVDPRNLRNPRRGMMWVALAGPVTNFLLAIVSLVALVVMQRFGLYQGFIGEPAARMVQACFVVNTALASFNLIPILPFDGGRVLMGILPGRLAWYYARSEPYGFFVALGLIMTGGLQWIMWPIYSTLLTVEKVMAGNLLRMFGI